MANFDVAYILTMGIEGGYANNPNDTGKETYKGVSRKNWPNLNIWDTIDAIKNRYGATADIINRYAGKDSTLQAQIKAFYKKEFWDVNKLDLVKYQSIANEMFDTAVNMGAAVAAEFLQQALNLCNRNQQSYKDIAEDGKISTGGETLTTLNTKANEKAVLNTLNMLQGRKYLGIMEAKKSQEEFWPSWLHRVIIN